jgi:m7GpppX diphosphatase
VKAVVIHPATEKHVQKYSDQEGFVVRETSELYREVTLPLLQSKQLSLQVRNSKMLDSYQIQL